MHKPAITPLVYARLFPNPKRDDPPTFQSHISRHLVPEVRQETQRFYGPIDSPEAQYPGLDYASPAHRMRLSAFHSHRQLFRVFDQLRLTASEIRTLCKWEGTRWARERYEREAGVTLRDTTWDDIEQSPRQEPTATRSQIGGGYSTLHHIGVVDAGVTELSHRDEQMEDLEESEEDEEDDEDEEGDEEEEDDEGEENSDDELSQSVGVQLNERLLAAVEARSRGEEAVIDADWEQWLKEAIERGSTSPTSPSVPTAGPSQPATHDTTTWGQTIPEVFSYAPETIPPPNVQSSRAQLPNPPFPAFLRPRPLPDASSVPPAPPAGTAM